MPKFYPPTDFMNRTWQQKIILFFAFGFGFGFLRPAPGTWGTIPGVIIGYWLMPFPYLHAFFCVLVFFLGIYLCEKASAILGVHDHRGIVIDEIAGVLITLLFFKQSVLIAFLGFIWFRLFDILKPPPIHWIDKRVNNGLGIMLDDIIAGLFAWGCLSLTLAFWVL